jgi:hypothetical protein
MGEWSASCPGRFTPGERASGTHWIRGWVDPRADLDSNSDSSVVLPVACPNTNYAIPASDNVSIPVRNLGTATIASACPLIWRHNVQDVTESLKQSFSFSNQEKASRSRGLPVHDSLAFAVCPLSFPPRVYRIGKYPRFIARSFFFCAKV